MAYRTYYLQFLLLAMTVFYLERLTKGTEADIFTHDYGQETASIKDILKDDEFIRDSVWSEDKKVVGYLIFKNENGGSNYVCIIIARIDKNGKIKDKIRKLSLQSLRKKDVLFGGITELKRIDNNASKILVRTGHQTAEVAPYKMIYKWEEINL